MSGDQTSLSKFLALVLRHRPEALGVTLSNEGWVPVDELLAALTAHGHDVDFAGLERLVAESDKQRFAFSDDRRLIMPKGHALARKRAVTIHDLRDEALLAPSAGRPLRAALARA